MATKPPLSNEDFFGILGRAIGRGALGGAENPIAQGIAEAGREVAQEAIDRGALVELAPKLARKVRAEPEPDSEPEPGDADAIDTEGHEVP